MAAALEVIGNLGVGEVCVGYVEAIPPGEGRTYRVGHDTVAVFRGRDGSLYAVQNECPHQRGPLSEGVAGGCTVICPMHGWKFNLETGACLNDPAHRLHTYPVREENGQLIVTF